MTAALTVPGFGCAIAAGHRDALDSECGKALDRVRFPAPWGFAAKFLFTAVTLGSGFKGVR